MLLKTSKFHRQDKTRHSCSRAWRREKMENKAETMVKVQRFTLLESIQETEVLYPAFELAQPRPKTGRNTAEPMGTRKQRVRANKNSGFNMDCTCNRCTWAGSRLWPKEDSHSLATCHHGEKMVINSLEELHRFYHRGNLNCAGCLWEG